MLQQVSELTEDGVVVPLDLYYTFGTPPKLPLIHALSLYGVPEAVLRLLTSAMLRAATRIPGSDTT